MVNMVKINECEYVALVDNKFVVVIPTTMMTIINVGESNYPFRVNLSFCTRTFCIIYP